MIKRSFLILDIPDVRDLTGSHITVSISFDTDTFLATIRSNVAIDVDILMEVLLSYKRFRNKKSGICQDMIITETYKGSDVYRLLDKERLILGDRIISVENGRTYCIENVSINDAIKLADHYYTADKIDRVYDLKKRLRRRFRMRYIYSEIL